jgi:hypothetical protein
MKTCVQPQIMDFVRHQHNGCAERPGVSGSSCLLNSLNSRRNDLARCAGGGRSAPAVAARSATFLLG